MDDIGDPIEQMGMCSFCGTLATLRCSNCRQVFYCKRECQREDWRKGHKEACQPVRVGENAALGRHLVATRNFKQGDVIFQEEPLIVGPKQLTEPICLSCYKRVNGNYRCSKCSWPLCGPECESGSDHQPECVIGQEIGSPIEIANFDTTNHFYEVVLPLRCLTLKKRSPKKYSQFINLESHYEERKGTSDYKENQKNIVNMLRNYFMLIAFQPDVIESSEYTIHKVIGILNTNAQDIPTGPLDICGIYPTFSMVEHSCKANVKCSFTKKKGLVVKAALNIKKGEHLTSLSTNVLWGTLARREHLKFTKFFMCTCSRCADPTELGTNFSSIRCQECNIGYMTSAAPLDQLADWICSNCNATLPVDTVKEKTVSVREEIDAALLQPNIQSLEKLIKEKTSIVHPNHFHLFTVKHTLLQLYGRDGVHNEETMKKKEGLCLEFLKICTILDPGMARLASYASMALYEYHVAVMGRNRQRDVGSLDPAVIRKDIGLAKALLRQAINIVADEPDDSPEGELRSLSIANLKDMEEMERSVTIS